MGLINYFFLFSKQEVYYKHSENRLEPDMAAMGYRTVFVESLGGRQGLATCFKKDMFDLLEEKNYAINDLIEKDIKVTTNECNFIRFTRKYPIYA